LVAYVLMTSALRPAVIDIGGPVPVNGLCWFLGGQCRDVVQHGRHDPETRATARAIRAI
jgi:hypothetical protein